MNAKHVTDHRIGTVELGEHLPLETPMSVFLLVASGCNFKCHYCVQSSLTPSDNTCPRTQQGSVDTFERMRDLKKTYPFMSVETITRFVEQAKKFPQKIKSIILASLGEPLLNPQVAEIVKIIKTADIAERVDIVTNSYCLTPELSDKLIEAGLDKLRISIQGIDSESYYQSSQVHIDFQKIVNQIAYFYQHKTNTTVYIKVMEEQLADENAKKQFYDIFEGICDQISIEHLVPLIPAFTDKPIAVRLIILFMEISLKHPLRIFGMVRCVSTF